MELNQRFDNRFRIPHPDQPTPEQAELPPPSNATPLLPLFPEFLLDPDTTVMNINPPSHTTTPAVTQPPTPANQATPLPPGPPPTTDQLLQALVTGQQLLTTAVTGLVNSMQANTSRRAKEKIIEKPTPFRGESGADARRFLSAFSMYAHTVDRLNMWDPVSQRQVADQEMWIASALSFLQDEAALWATPYMEEIANGKGAFHSSWAEFRTQFKLRFEPADQEVDAKEKLRLLWQGKKTVPEYAARFKETMARTGYSEADLRDRFYEHLSPAMKDELVHTERPIKKLDDLITVATAMDIRLRARASEKAREQGRTPVPTPKFTPAPPVATPFKDPNAMDIDATRGPNGKSKFDFLSAMKGRCFGCGSSQHNKRDGGHERDLCSWCLRTGHKDSVCQDRYLGHPRKQKVAASDTPTPDAPEVSAAGPSNSASVSATTTGIDLASMQQQLAELTKTVAAFKECF